MASTYSIRDLEALSGIKAHTIRIWELRYGILKAARTQTNIRYYNEHELKYLLSLALLNRNGFKISKLALLNEPEVASLVNDLVNVPLQYQSQIEWLVLAAIEYDEEKFERILNTCILQLSLEETIKKVVFPYLEKIGMLWVSGTVIAAQEHFMTQLLRQKILVAIDGRAVKINASSQHFILFLPNGEWHEMGLLFMSYLLKTRNHRVTYLGSSVPVNDVINIGNALKPNAFHTVITTANNQSNVPEYLNKLALQFPEIKIFVSGAGVKIAFKGLEKNVIIVNDINTVLEDVERNLQQNNL